MFTSTMSLPEIKLELERDKPMNDETIGRIYLRLRKKALKNNRFPITLSDTFKNKRSGNRYIVAFIFKKRRDCIIDDAIISYVCIGTFQTPRGLFAVTRDVNGGTIMLFTPHVFRRYVERTKCRKRGMQAIVDFVNSNPCIQPMQGLRETEYELYGKMFSSVAVCTEGVLLGEIEPNTGDIIFKTFITYDMLTVDQQTLARHLNRQLVEQMKYLDGTMYEDVVANAIRLIKKL